MNWLIWVAAAMFVGSLAQSITGFGFSLVAVSLMTVVISPTNAIVGQTLASLPITIIVARKLWPLADRVAIRQLLPGSIIGMPLGLVIAARVSDKSLRFAVGIAVIFAAVSIATGWRLPKTNRYAEYFGGLVSGVLATTTGTNGPPLVISLAARDLAPAAFRATLQALFVVSSVISLPLFAIAGSVTKVSLQTAAISFLPTVAGRVIGERVFDRLDVQTFRRIVLAMLFLAGGVALAKASVS